MHFPKDSIRIFPIRREQSSWRLNCYCYFFSLLFNLCPMGTVLLSIMLFHVWLSFYCFVEPLFMGRILCGDNPSHLHSFPDMSVRPSLIQRFSVWISTRLPLSLSFMSPMVDTTNSVVSQNYQKIKRVMERNFVCSCHHVSFGVNGIKNSVCRQRRNCLAFVSWQGNVMIKLSYLFLCRPWNTS